MYGDSRPASGTEHHLAHFWEMRMLKRGQKPALHGIKVGLATIVGLILWKELIDVLDKGEVTEPDSTSSSCSVNSPDSIVFPDCDDSKNYESEIRRLYGQSAEAILQTENPNLPTELIKANKQAILEIARSLPTPEEIAAMLFAVGAPIRPSGICLDGNTLRDSIIYARDRKKTYTVLQLLGDLNCLESFADRVSRHFYINALEGVKCYVMDMDGTLYLSDKVFPYSVRFLEHLTRSGNDHVFYTNNSSQNAAYYLKKLHRMGIPVKPDKLLMSTHVLLAHLHELKESRFDNQPGTRVFVAGTKALMDDFENAGFELTDKDPDFVVLGFDTDMNYKRLTMLCDFVRAGLPYYGVHIDYNCPIEGGFIPDCGSLASAVTAATGVTPEFFGKPSRHTLEYITRKTGYREDELCFIGDRLYTDIAIAADTKARSVLVLSGETKRNDLNETSFVPDIVVKDLEELTKYF